MQKNRIILLSAITSFCMITLSCKQDIYHDKNCKQLDKQKENADTVRLKEKIALFDKYAMYDVSKLKTLIKIYTHSQFKTEFNFVGWVINDSGSHFKFFTYDMRLIDDNSLKVDSLVTVCPENIKSELPKNKNLFDTDFGKYYLLASWLFKNGYSSYAYYYLISNENKLPADTFIMQDFATRNYDNLLKSFSRDRNYKEALIYATYLLDKKFENYEYHNTIKDLAAQLKSREDDFDKFKNPDTTAWLKLKKNLNREQQIEYLLDRLQLLNCIQPGQPGRISYASSQSSISAYELGKMGMNIFNFDRKYLVINPYNELMAMKFSPKEIKSITPYLLDDNYIPTYSYSRDFFPERTLHQVSWVVYEIISKTLNKEFVNDLDIAHLSQQQQKELIIQIESWCDKQNR